MWDLDLAILGAGLVVAYSVQRSAAHLKVWAEYQQRVLHTEVEGMIQQAARAIITETHPTYRAYHEWKG